MKIPILSIITFLPLAGALFLIFINKEKKNLVRYIALIFAIANFLISLTLFFNFNSATTDPQFVEQAGWIGYGIKYHIGIDGITNDARVLRLAIQPDDVGPAITHIIRAIHRTGILRTMQKDLAIGGKRYHPVASLRGRELGPASGGIV